MTYRNASMHTTVAALTAILLSGCAGASFGAPGNSAIRTTANDTLSGKQRDGLHDSSDDVPTTPTPTPGATTSPTPNPTVTAGPSATPVPGGTATPGPTASPTASPSPTPSASPTPDPSDVCTGRSQQTKVLIVDLKSGWFAGDGGKFFQNFVVNKCGDLLEVSYVHITQSSVDGNLAETTGGKDILPCIGTQSSRSMNTKNCEFESLADFDEFWLLSGSSSDDQDIALDGTTFKSLVGRVQDLRDSRPDASFFFGAGIGNLDHSNAMFSALFPTLANNALTLFDHNHWAPLGTYPNPNYATQFTKATLLPSNVVHEGMFNQLVPVFIGLTSLYDFTRTSHKVKSSTGFSGPELGECLTDPVMSTALDVIAHDHCDQTAIAQGTIHGHKVFAEGNMARFYGTAPADYFNRIIVSLFP